MKANLTMRKKLHHYFAPTKDELEALWSEGLLVFDANVLLNLYRYSLKTREELLHFFDQAKDQVWLPHQAALEFLENRLSVLKTETGKYNDFLSEFSRILEKLKISRGNPFTTEAIQKRLEVIHEEIKKDFEPRKREFDDSWSSDPILERVTTLFLGRVGDPFTEPELEEIYAEGEIRYAKGIPPGFKDDKKNNGNKFGDLVLWKQILREAKAKEQSVVFVTDDRKQDWWWEQAGKKVGPRPQLKEEFTKASGRSFHLYGSEQFLLHAGKHFGRKVDRKAIEEVREAQMYRSKLQNDRKVDKELAFALRGAKRAADRLDQIKRLIEVIEDERATCEYCLEPGSPASEEDRTKFRDEMRQLEERRDAAHKALEVARGQKDIADHRLRHAERRRQLSRWKAGGGKISYL
jgi:hypothetical protein